MKKKFFFVVSIFLLFSSIFFGQLAGNIPRDETLIAESTAGRVTAPSRFNVWINASTWPQRGIQQVMLEPLWMNEQALGEIINSLAAEGPIYNEDFTQMTIKLRKGCYWSDGVEITADDIVYGIELTMKTPGMAYHDQFELYIDKVYKTDDYTVLIELKEPNSRFHANFVDRWGAWRPFPKHIFEKVEDPLTFDFNPPISSGPYVLKDYDPAGYWTLWEKREDWDRTPNGMLFGEPKPKNVLFYYYGTAEMRVIQQSNHQLDVAYFTPESLRAVINQNEYSRPYNPNYPWIVNIDPCTTGITLNNDVYPYNIKDVRWALTLAIDIVDAAAIAYDGAVVMASMLLPPTPAYQEWYYEPMEEWLRNFTLDIEVDGEPFKPYDPNAPLRLAEYARSRGYDVPDDPEEIRELFGPGWWKYAPDVAEQLLERNGFTRDKNGKWLLPDGTAWEITILAATDPAKADNKNPIAVAQQWRKFGIEVNVETNEAHGDLTSLGDYQASGGWPAMEPWGGHPDLHRTFNVWHSQYYKPIGERAVGNGATSRWTDPRMDEIIEEMEKLDWDDPRNIELGMEGLKILVEEMPSIPTFIHPLFLVYDEYYWTNWPSPDNLYTQPCHCFPNFKYMLPFLEPTGRK
ncbi:peptide ABC transporter substrate-binding protein [Petrotoga miotherma DSM 10691]|uniref:Peptide ABC transporter substrate-binding protein n=2 Tax=Petrotoga TaxID=28236 RepID=A0A2K1P7E2_9BACT|nr:MULTISPECIES: ABC transporter substrate-binding protein [Petrotoga]PNR98713.1 peptide ABC transporter substrate-binding protein [Petrotoga miotherma DSM 10691]POZ92756.1 peptide ABC transporter substrate-binding protein [Petrotoga halophila DSM 16923]